MSALAKGGLFALGVASIITGTWYLSGDSMPTFTLLYADTHFTNKYGFDYSRFFIGFTSDEIEHWKTDIQRSKLKF